MSKVNNDHDLSYLENHDYLHLSPLPIVQSLVAVSYGLDGARACMMISTHFCTSNQDYIYEWWMILVSIVV